MFSLKTTDSGCQVTHKNRTLAVSTRKIAENDLDKATRGFFADDLRLPSRCGAIVRRLEKLGYSMKPLFREVSQVVLEIAIWPAWQKFARGRKFWALRLLIDDVTPNLVQEWLRSKQMLIQKPLFDNQAGLERFCKHLTAHKSERRWLERWTLHLNVEKVVSFLKDLDMTFPGHLLVIFIKDALNHDKSWLEMNVELGLEHEDYPLRPKVSSQAK